MSAVTVRGLPASGVTPRRPTESTERYAKESKHGHVEIEYQETALESKNNLLARHENPDHSSFSRLNEKEWSSGELIHEIKKRQNERRKIQAYMRRKNAERAKLLHEKESQKQCSEQIRKERLDSLQSYCFSLSGRKIIPTNDKRSSSAIECVDTSMASMHEKEKKVGVVEAGDDTIKSKELFELRRNGIKPELGPIKYLPGTLLSRMNEDEPVDINNNSETNLRYQFSEKRRIDRTTGTKRANYSLRSRKFPVTVDERRKGKFGGRESKEVSVEADRNKRLTQREYGKDFLRAMLKQVRPRRDGSHQRVKPRKHCANKIPENDILAKYARENSKFSVVGICKPSFKNDLNDSGAGPEANDNPNSTLQAYFPDSSESFEAESDNFLPQTSMVKVPPDKEHAYSETLDSALSVNKSGRKIFQQLRSPAQFDSSKRFVETVRAEKSQKIQGDRFSKNSGSSYEGSRRRPRADRRYQDSLEFGQFSGSKEKLSQEDEAQNQVGNLDYGDIESSQLSSLNANQESFQTSSPNVDGNHLNDESFEIYGYTSFGQCRNESDTERQLAMHESQAKTGIARTNTLMEASFSGDESLKTEPSSEPDTIKRLQATLSPHSRKSETKLTSREYLQKLLVTYHANMQKQRECDENLLRMYEKSLRIKRRGQLQYLSYRRGVDKWWIKQSEKKISVLKSSEERLSEQENREHRLLSQDSQNLKSKYKLERQQVDSAFNVGLAFLQHEKIALNAKYNAKKRSLEQQCELLVDRGKLLESHTNELLLNSEQFCMPDRLRLVDLILNRGLGSLEPNEFIGVDELFFRPPLLSIPSSSAQKSLATERSPVTDKQRSMHARHDDTKLNIDRSDSAAIRIEGSGSSRLYRVDGAGDNINKSLELEPLDEHGFSPLNEPDSQGSQRSFNYENDTFDEDEISPTDGQKLHKFSRNVDVENDPKSSEVEIRRLEQELEEKINRLQISRETSPRRRSLETFPPASEINDAEQSARALDINANGSQSGYIDSKDIEVFITDAKPEMTGAQQSFSGPHIGFASAESARLDSSGDEHDSSVEIPWHPKGDRDDAQEAPLRSTTDGFDLEAGDSVIEVLDEPEFQVLHGNDIEYLTADEEIEEEDIENINVRDDQFESPQNGLALFSLAHDWETGFYDWSKYNEQYIRNLFDYLATVDGISLMRKWRETMLSADLYRTIDECEREYFEDVLPASVYAGFQQGEKQPEFLRIYCKMLFDLLNFSLREVLIGNSQETCFNRKGQIRKSYSQALRAIIPVEDLVSVADMVVERIQRWDILERGPPVGDPLNSSALADQATPESWSMDAYERLNTIINMEIKEQDAEWSDYGPEELEIICQVSDSLLDDLLLETAQHIQLLLPSRYT